jgi:cytochrome c oxidase subunit 2
MGSEKMMLVKRCYPSEDALQDDSNCLSIRIAKATLLLALLFVATSCHRAPVDSAPPDVKIPIVMKQWAIVPSRIVVRRGQHVELDVTTADVEHGLGIAGLGVRESVQPGFTTVIRFHATESGEFLMNCSILCGRGHDEMTGKLVVN